MKLRWWKTADEMATAFEEKFPAQWDDVFLSECGLDHSAEAIRVGLAVRRSVAEYGMVSAVHIYADHSLPGELQHISGWDSVDFVSWIILLEEELGEPVDSRWFDQLRIPYTVRDFAQAVYNNRQTA